MTARYSVEVRVGRLIEARVFSLTTAAEADEYGRAIIAATQRAPKTPVLCADHRPVAIYPQPAADRLVEMFRPNNQRFERIAIVAAPTNATLLLQLERIVREAGSTKRRVFRDAAGAIDHLLPILDPRELARARSFLAEHSAPS
jgi:hypothetical protein